MPSQRDGWVLVNLSGPGLTLIARDDGTWSVVGGAAVVVLVAAAIITPTRSGLGTAGRDGFWRAAPRPSAATLLLLCPPRLVVGSPWAIAAGVLMALGLWGVVAAVARVVRWPDQPAG